MRTVLNLSILLAVLAGAFSLMVMLTAQQRDLALPPEGVFDNKVKDKDSDSYIKDLLQPTRMLVQPLPDEKSFDMEAKVGAPVVTFYSALLDQLLAANTDLRRLHNIRLVVGDFECGAQEHPGVSAFSGVIKRNMIAAAKTNKKFTPLNGPELGALIEKGEVASVSDLMDPDKSCAGMRQKSIDAVFKGRYFYHYPKATVSGELTLLSTGVAYPVTGDVPMCFGEKVERIPKAELAEVEKKKVRPFNTKTQVAVQNDIKDLSEYIPSRKIRASVWTESGDSIYFDGDDVELRVVADKDCHIAVLEHFSDGNSLLLFPNKLEPDSRVKAGKKMALPGGQPLLSHFFKASPPYGKNIFQVIACDSKAEFDAMLSSKTPIGATPFSKLDRKALLRHFSSDARIGSGAAYGESSMSAHIFQR